MQENGCQSLFFASPYAASNYGDLKDTRMTGLSLLKCRDCQFKKCRKTRLVLGLRPLLVAGHAQGYCIFQFVPYDEMLSDD